MTKADSVRTGWGRGITSDGDGDGDGEACEEKRTGSVVDGENRQEMDKRKTRLGRDTINL